MEDNQHQQIDHYDFINAPQFVDFSDLAAQDDPDADKFFETHREEDDFMIPLDINTISPTVQLLYNGNEENNEHYSNEANKAAMAAGLEDVKIEYYASPPPQSSSVLSQPNSANNKKSLNSVYGTPLGAQSGSSSATSFYTPTGGNEDKENLTPSSALSASKNYGENGSSQKLGKWSEETTPTLEKAHRSILIDKPHKFEDSRSTMQAYTSPGTTEKANSKSPVTDSLMSRLNELSMISSDEDDDSYNSVVSPPQQSKNAPITDAATFTTFNEGKLTFLGVGQEERPTSSIMESLNSSTSSSCVSDTDATLVLANHEKQLADEEFASDSDSSGDEGCGASSMEMRSPVNKILKILEAQLNMEEEEDDDPRCSIVVAPRVGEQVHWSCSDANLVIHDNTAAAGSTNNREFTLSDDPHGNHAHGDYFEGSSESTLEMHGLDISAGCGGLNYRRASSVGDLVRAIEVAPKERQFETYGYNPRVGITIPKTPDVPKDVNIKRQQDKVECRQELANSNKNACYFEIAAPTPVKSIRRVSSCSDLISFQQKAKQIKSRRIPQKMAPPPKKALTIPRTPDTLKRTQKSKAERHAESNASSAGSTSSKCGGASRRANAAFKGPSVAERLASAKTRQPVKANHYVSMAEAMIKYQKNTPDRFRSLPRGRLVPEKRAISADSRRRADPSPARSPDCATSMMAPRSRAGSFSEKRDLRTNTAKNTVVGPILPKKVELKPTIPKPFNLSCGQRNRPAPAMPVSEDVVDFKFKARPAPTPCNNTSIMLHKSRPQVKVTQPMSPHFASDDRLRERHQKRAQTRSPESKQGKAGVTFVKPSRLPTAASSARAHHVEEHKTTVAQPFSSSFDARQKEVLRRKEEKIKQELEESRRGWEFHANPAPKFSKHVPKKKPIEVTHAEPFRLKSDERGAHYQEQFKKKLEEEEQRLKELAKFHAQPADVIHKPPFEPERHTRVIEGPDEFYLATEKRAAEREQFDEQLREKEREEEERRREEQEMLEELQRQEDMEKRRQLVHKAHPFKAPKPFHLKASGKPLTVPQSPAFSALPSERRIKPHSPQQQNGHTSH